MLCPPQAPAPLVQQWLDRHQGPVNFALHMVGIPPTILGVLLIPVYLGLASVPIFLLALAIFVGGFLIQFAGHALEGTDPGEVIMIKRRLGWPYVEYAPGRGPSRHTAI